MLKYCELRKKADSLPEGRKFKSEERWVGKPVCNAGEGETEHYTSLRMVWWHAREHVFEHPMSNVSFKRGER